jgi:hypothetical protein
MPTLPRGGRSLLLGSAGAAALCWCLTAGTAGAQVLLDRVLALVNGSPVTLSDVQAGLGLGLIVAGQDEIALATEQWIQRQLLLSEVERFPPPEPEVAAIDAEEARIRRSIQPSLAVLSASTGLDERQVRQSARDNLRIRAYLDQRFGAMVQVNDEEARAYYTGHPDEFMRNGSLAPFDEVEAEVRQRAAAVRRQDTIEQWMADLRQRADVIVTRE